MNVRSCTDAAYWLASPLGRSPSFQADMDDYITKQVRTDELGLLLARWVPADSSGDDEHGSADSLLPHTAA